MQRELAAIEQSAKHVRHLLPTMITGLLQTPEYALQSVSGPIETALTDTMRHEIVSHKLRRQRVLYDPSRHLTFLLTEAALRWQLVGPAAMSVQLEKIASMAAVSNISVEVLPLARQVPDCPLEVSVIYDDRLVHIETSSGTIALRDPQDIAYHRAQFDFYSTHALKSDEAADFIRGIADEFRRGAE